VKRPIVAGVLFVFAAACGGGGGGTPTQPQPSLTFTAAGTAGPASISLVQAAGSTSTRLRLTVHAEQLSGVFGVAFDLVYPGNAIRFDTASQGTYLGGVSTSFQVTEPTAGRLVVGISRLGPVAGVSGSGDLATLEFVSRGIAGTDTLTFQANTVYDATAKPIAGVTWLGGSATVVP
jgi:hypothetical protein